jgi:hypothetical protein
MMDYYLEDMEGLDDDEYADMEEQMLAQFGFLDGHDHEHHGHHGKPYIDLTEDDGPKWVYTGTKNQKETRAACKEVRITHNIWDNFRMLTFLVRYRLWQIHRGYH